MKLTQAEQAAVERNNDSPTYQELLDFYNQAYQQLQLIPVVSHLAEFIEKVANGDGPLMTSVVIQREDDQTTPLLKLWASAGLHSPMDRIRELNAALDAANERADEYEQLFEMQRQAERRGIELWRSEKPGRELKEPDTANFTAWLLNRLEFDETVFKELTARVEAAEKALRGSGPASLSRLTNSARRSGAKADSGVVGNE